MPAKRTSKVRATRAKQYLAGFQETAPVRNHRPRIQRFGPDVFMDLFMAREFHASDDNRGMIVTRTVKSGNGGKHPVPFCLIVVKRSG